MYVYVLISYSVSNPKPTNAQTKPIQAPDFDLYNVPFKPV